MKKVLMRRLADDQSRSSSSSDNSKDSNNSKDLFETQLQKAIKIFVIMAKYTSPPCFGMGCAFPDGDPICQNCPRFQVVEEDLKSYIDFFIKKGYSPHEAYQLALEKFSCEVASAKRINSYLEELKKIEERVRNNYSDYQEIRIQKMQEEVKYRLENQKREAVKMRKREIEKLMEEKNQK